MSTGPFDYGDDDDDSSARGNNSFNELDDILGTSGAEHRRPPPSPRNSLLADLDMRVILQVVVAVVLLALAGGLVARDAWARRARDTAFNQMVDATGKREYLRVIEGAEKFLTHPPSNGGKDAREANVVSLYSEALVHWVAQQPGKLDDTALKRIGRYKQLVKSTDK
jgi:hypothetical protein